MRSVLPAISLSVLLAACEHHEAAPRQLDGTQIGRLRLALSNSDGWSRYERTMKPAAQELVENRSCEIGAFVEQGGWTKSSAGCGGEVCYFVHCDDDRTTWYLLPTDGAIYKLVRKDR